MTNQAQELKNDNINVTVSKEPGCKIKLTVAVSPAATIAAYKKALKNVNKEASLPGFRKGKAPDAMIEQNFGKFVNQEWQDVVVQTAFREAVNLTKLYPYKEETIQKPRVASLDKTAGATVHFEYECPPNIPSVDTQSLKVTPVKTHEVTKKDIDESIEGLRHHFATWEEVTDRPIQEGDHVDLDIDALETPPVQICQNQRFIVQEGKMGNWLRKLLIGKNVGETVEGVSEKEPHKHADGEDCNECHHGEPEFKPTHCRIIIKGIKKAVLPELNDEIAAKVGAETVATLLQRIEEDHKRRAEEDRLEKLRGQIEQSLLEKYPFELPASLMTAERKARVARWVQSMKEQQVPRDVIASKSVEAEQQIGKEVDHAFRLYFLISKIAEENKIDVTQDELMKEMVHQMMLQQSGQAIIDQNMPAEEMRSRLYSVVLTKKTKDFLVEKAQKE